MREWNGVTQPAISNIANQFLSKEHSGNVSVWPAERLTAYQERICSMH
jgi:hypothetical protein